MNKMRALYAIAVLVLAQFACNMPAFGGGEQVTPDIPSPNQTLTALFAITPLSATATATLPPVVTATSASADQNPTATGQPDSTSPTATSASASTNPTATNTPPTTVQSTATRPAPAATATIPSARAGTQVIANFLNTAPTLDGDWSEWKDITKEYPANNVVFGRQNWTNEDDLSASYHIGWDNTYLYIAVKVRDDRYVQNATGENIFKGDSIELLVDTKLRDDYYTTQLSPDDFQLGISPGRPDTNGTKEAYLWFPSRIAGSRGDVKIGSRTENGVYRIEAAIPWTVFEMTPAAGMHLGFAISVSDNDNPNENVQQSMVSSVSGRRLTDPTTWGDLQLVK
jgi:hypothetical protein